MRASGGRRSGAAGMRGSDGGTEEEAVMPTSVNDYPNLVRVRVRVRV
jgi:hypothetical protein